MFTLESSAHWRSPSLPSWMRRVTEPEEEPQLVVYDVVKPNACGIDRTRVGPASDELGNPIRRIIHSIRALHRKGIQ